MVQLFYGGIENQIMIGKGEETGEPFENVCHTALRDRKTNDKRQMS